MGDDGLETFLVIRAAAAYEILQVIRCLDDRLECRCNVGEVGDTASGNQYLGVRIGLASPLVSKDLNGGFLEWQYMHL